MQARGSITPGWSMQGPFESCSRQSPTADETLHILLGYLIDWQNVVSGIVARWGQRGNGPRHEVNYRPMSRVGTVMYRNQATCTTCMNARGQVEGYTSPVLVSYFRSALRWRKRSAFSVEEMWSIPGSGYVTGEQPLVMLETLHHGSCRACFSYGETGAWCFFSGCSVKDGQRCQTESCQGSEFPGCFSRVGRADAPDDHPPGHRGAVQHPRALEKDNRAQKSARMLDRGGCVASKSLPVAHCGAGHDERGGQAPDVLDMKPCGDVRGGAAGEE
ncbi:hypothetical protein M011DRAFT_460176 [Sporormia fimetaria CBS 119925]|uniref:Uncharacterized protein n=1 Tax=Sporormia fimetaria CBS 119925 TaxID=1340428 RepID=A0A6A6V3U1_9PLEO|nr:hypothetical protein M011DRAFT_460176 [Sporormia fimetaria CBS 119925]